MTTTNRRLIEDWLPIKEISVEAVREGGALAGHPPVNQLHVWWARRPLVASRAAVGAALLDADADRSRFVRAIGSTDSVVDERRRMDEIKATGEWSDVSFSNKRTFTHNLTAAEREWFRGGLAVAARWCWTSLPGAAASPSRPGGLACAPSPTNSTPSPPSSCGLPASGPRSTAPPCATPTPKSAANTCNGCASLYPITKCILRSHNNTNKKAKF